MRYVVLATGIQLALYGNSGLPLGTQQLLRAKPKNWGSAITARVEDLVLYNNRFTVPAMPGKQLTGRISGILIVPRPRGSGFSDESIDVNIPIILNIVAQRAERVR